MKNYNQKFKSQWEEIAGLNDEISQTGRESGYDVSVIANDIINKLEIKSGEYILDNGCGNGLIASIIALKARKVIGVDFSKKQIETAKKREKDNLEFLEAESRNLPFSDNSFDKAIFYSVAHYLSYRELESSLEELRRVCKPEAKILIGDVPDMKRILNYYSPVKAAGFLVKRYILEPMSLSAFFIKNPVWNRPSWNFYRFCAIKSICEKLGLEAEHVRQDKFLPYSHYRFDILITNKK